MLIVAVLTVVKYFFTTLVRKVGGAPEVRLGRSLCPGASALPPPYALAASNKVTLISKSMKISEKLVQNLLPNLPQVTETWVRVDDLVSIATPISTDWEDFVIYEGFTLNVAKLTGEASEEKAFFTQFPHTKGWLNEEFTPSIVVALIELAELVLKCDRLFICIERDSKEVNDLVHSLMYVGFSLATFPITSKINPNYLLLEYKTE